MDLILSFSCLDHRVLKKEHSGCSEYGFYSYGELCHFVYCLLSQSRQVADMPVLDDWDTNLDVAKVAALGKVDTDGFLVIRLFGTELRRANTGKVRDIRSRCREFGDRLVIFSFIW